MLRFYLPVFCIFLAERMGHVHGSAGNIWTYRGALGPDHWHLDYPHCGGTKQSPISIDTGSVVVDTERLQPFQFNGYGEIMDVNMTLENNGHTVLVGLNTHMTSISGGGLIGTYIAEQFHFHWGAVDSRGSEHDINGRYFPMEMHIVHYNNKYPNISAAMSESGGLAVLGFFFKVGRYNSDFQTIIFNFEQIRYKNLHTEIKYIPLIELIPSALTSYYRYLGSLTTPPCYESVTWTLFNETIEIAEEQLEQFRTAIFENDARESAVSIDISDDFRPPQCLFRRNVYASTHELKFNPNGEEDARQERQVYDPNHGTVFGVASVVFLVCIVLPRTL